MSTRIRVSVRLLACAVFACVFVAGCERPSPTVTQEGYRGTGMADVQNPRLVEQKKAESTIPTSTPQAPAGGPLSATSFQNVKVLGNVSVPEFTRLMLAMTSWVSPQEGCAYCHDATNMAADTKYTKIVARRMIEMTQHINSSWKTHVADTGVTCFTCHRGNPVPTQIWFDHPNDVRSSFAGNKGGQNEPTPAVGLTSLPYDPFTTFLEEEGDVRVVASTALPNGDMKSIKQTEWTYALMMHFSQSLGVNCTYCHNSRSFTDWDQSSPQRATAWYGIRMARDLNNNFLNPLGSTLPQARHGVLGDGPKVGCATCHKGAFKPLYGAKMLADYPELAAPTIAAPTQPAPEAPAGNATGM